MLQFKKSKPKSDKVATKQNKTKQNKTKQLTTIFMPKMYKVFLSLILQNLKGRFVLPFGQLFFENDPLDEPNQMPLSKTRICASLGSRMKFKTLCYPVFRRN